MGCRPRYIQLFLYSLIENKHRTAIFLLAQYTVWQLGEGGRPRGVGLCFVAIKQILSH